MNDWVKNAPVAVTVCDAQGRILEMNNRSAKTFAKSGGAGLIGKNLFDCHPGPAGEKLKELLKNPRANAYTIEKGGVKKLIYQFPWSAAEGEFDGLVELSIELPPGLPHFIRD